MNNLVELSRAEKIKLAKKLLRDRQGSTDKRYPMSSHQKRLWFLAQFPEANIAYNQRIVFNIDGELNVPAFKQAAGCLFQRHEAFRTRFESKGAILEQVVAAEAEAGVEVQQCDDETRAAEVIQELLSRPFDLSRGPLVRAHVLSVGSDRHMIVLVLHHIITDSFSMDIIRRELLGLYQDFSRGCVPALSPLSWQYGDYARWEHDFLQSAQFRCQLEFWQQQLSGLPPLLELATDKPRPKEKSYRGTRVKLHLSPQISEALELACRQTGTTKFMYLLACFKLVLSVYSRQDDVFVGTTIANREKEQWRDLVGLLVNNLVLRTRLDWQASFKTLLATIKQVCLQAYGNADVAFNQVVDALNPERSPSYSPLFQVMFTFHGNKSARQYQADKLELELAETRHSSSIFDLSLNLAELKSGILGYVEYDTDLFLPGTIENMTGLFSRLVEQTLADGDRPLNRYSLVEPAGHWSRLRRFNDTGIRHTPEGTLLDLIEAICRRVPQKIAVSDDGARQLSYQQLWAGSARVARFLRVKGVRPGDRVAVMMPRSCDLLVALLGILRAKAGYLPLETSLPEQRIRYMLENAGCGILLTDQQALDKRGAEKVDVIAFGDIPAADDGAEHDALPGVTGEDLAYVIYTSGSTGKPKGVEISHKAIANRLHWMLRKFRFDSSDIVLQKTPYGFDVSVWELFLPLLTGAKVVFARPDGHKDLDYLQKVLAEENITSIHFVPSMFETALDMMPPSSWQGLKRIFCGGEVLEKHTVEKFYRTGSPAQLYNLYGPTEATIGVTAFDCREHLAYKHIPIGKPIDNTKLMVLGSGDQQLPVGVTGHLHIGGVQLAKGYINQAELSQKQFVELEYDGSRERFYKTGDLVRWLPCGNIEYIGRIDHQVKIRGFRIECQEIEQHILALPQTGQAHVLAMKVGEVMSLCAFIVKSSAYAADTDEQVIAEIKAALAQSLPDYMVPQHFSCLEHMPVNQNGKLDRHALARAEFAKIEKAVRLPQTPEEEAFAAIVIRVLGRRGQQINLNDSLFELGGNSLQAMRLLTLVNEEFAAALTIKDVFDSSSLLAFFGLIAADSGGGKNEAESDDETEVFAF
ncbi:non-ribosomal peptide synthetase [Thalassomonas viridans]|uniref:Non-ribosomal peptide synthetase n=1 Tax=Thalassomonas viridans TaxID=137584 RepID=A0AAE9ZBJ6_9GAMM|nr:non-ribosomal peptide synthetase [Thalassomonas viridans]WDE09264.1 non-ribosomal peptide synthetase [Thalassomonas viridans]